MYCIIDIETTGGDKQSGKITEVAIYRHDGKKIVDEFVSLINPERRIPPHITYLTGITNEMVSKAPKFFEVAKRVVEITEDAKFVAHNVNFDFGFIAKEFRDLGYSYERDKICTVRKSRQLIPGLPSYSLGKLCKSLNIQIHDRHRAAGDALATVLLFEKLLHIEPDLKSSSRSGGKSVLGLNTHLKYEEVNKLPDKTGVYYFRNASGDIIYIGKSKNIRARVFSHLRLTKSDRVSRMQQEIHYIDFELTGSELISLIKESIEIKQFKPKFNRAQRKSFFPFAVYVKTDLFGYLHLYCDKTAGGEKALSVFSSKVEARNKLHQICEQFNLCYGFCGIGQCGKSCFHHSVEMCAGAMLGKEAPEEYNLRVHEAIDALEYHNDNVLLIDDGRHHEEFACVLIENGMFRGYGYADKSFAQSVSCMVDCIEYVDETRDIKNIVRHFMHNNKVRKKISLNRESEKYDS